MPSLSSPKEYLLKKDFVVKTDSSTGKQNVKLRLFNRSTKEIVYLTYGKGSEGARTFEVQYYTANQEEYSKIVRSLLKAGYVNTSDNRHYEKKPGSYETQQIFCRDLVLLRDMEYYAITYTYLAGKELSAPSPTQGK